MSTKSQLKRLEISYIDGVNMIVSHVISKRQELEIAENARGDKIGTVTKRNGYIRLGNALASTANFGLYYFDSEGKNMYRVSSVAATTSIYYLNNSSVWTSLLGEGTGLEAATCDFVEAESCLFIMNGTDSNRYINSNQYFFTVTAANATIGATYTNNGKTFTVLATIAGGTSLTTSGTGSPSASGTLTKATGTGDATITFSANSLNVVTSATATGHLYNSPKANKVNFYKDRLYIGDYYIGSTRYPTGIMKSSEPLGIVGLIDGDHTTPGADDWVTVTDTKYIYATDILDIYRGGTKIADLTVKAKTETSFQINAITFASGVNFNSSDEIWVDGTYTGARVFRWVDNAASGENVKRYDTMKLTGGDNSALTLFTNIGDIMMIANKYNLATYNGTQPIPTSFDLGVGCISGEGWVKTLGTLFFLGYNGIYATTGDTPKLISAKIQPLFDGASKDGLEAGAMGRKGLSIFCSLGDVTLYNLDGSINRVLSDVVVERNLRTENWYIHTGIDAKFFHRYITSSDIEKLEFCSSSSNVNDFLQGTKDDDSDEIPFRIDSGKINLTKNFENISYPREIILESERGIGIKCFVSLDGGDFYELLGESEKGCTVFKVTAHGDDEEPARCRSLGLSFREYSDRICSISRCAILYAQTNEQEEHRA